jgi:hypothetical protein
MALIMRIIYRGFSGKRTVKEFNDWRELCVWLKRAYPLLLSVQQMGEMYRELVEL